MNFLLDTHSFLWAVWDDPKLSRAAKALILNPDTEIYLSLASVWEIAIKVGIGKLSLARPVEAFIPLHLAGLGIDLLHPTLEDVLRVASLPLHHREPFDRLLISQSLTQGMPMISADSNIDAYGVQRIW